MSCNSKLPVTLWRVMSVKLNIAKKIAGLELMTLSMPNLRNDIEGGATLFTGMF